MTQLRAPPARLVYTPRDIKWNRAGTNVELNKCLANATVRKLFAEFQAKEFSLENLLFLEDCVLFFQDPTEQRFTELNERFVSPNAQHQVNVGVPTKKAFATATSLDDMQAAVALAEVDLNRLCGQDTFNRFKKDSAFTDFLKTPEGVELFPELQT